MTTGHSQAGVALITALLIVSLATITAVSMASRQQLEIRRTANLLFADQAYLFAVGGEKWAESLLIRDLRQNKGQTVTDHLKEDWAKELPPTPVEGGTISGYIEDMQGRFNLNNLYFERQSNPEQSGAYLTYFKRLLVALQIEEHIAYKVADWLDENDEPQRDGAEDIDYLNAEIPYRAANRKMASPSELLLVKGVDAKVYERLAPYVTALPEATPLNFNTIAEEHVELVEALSEQIDDKIAKDLLAQRTQEPYSDKDAIVKRINDYLGGESIDPDNNNLVKQMVDVSSSYFLVHAQVEIERASLELLTALYRSAQNGKIEVLTRSLGEY